MSEQDTRRRHLRVDTNQSVWVEGQDVRLEAQARNMSKGGMFVVSKADSPSLGATLQITFDDPLEGAVEVKMEVVWREENTATTRLGLRALDSQGSATFERVVARYEGAQVEEPGSDGTTAPTTLVPEPE